MSVDKPTMRIGKMVESKPAKAITWGSLVWFLVKLAFEIWGNSDNG